MTQSVFVLRGRPPARFSAGRAGAGKSESKMAGAIASSVPRISIKRTA